MADEVETVPGDGAFRDDVVDAPTMSVSTPVVPAVPAGGTVVAADSPALPSLTLSAAPAAPANIGEEAIAAARALIDQEREDIKTGAWKRALRTLGQSAAAAAATAGYTAYHDQGIHDWSQLAHVGGSAALTVVISYVWNRVRPAAK